MKPQKPLLATNVEDFSKLRFPAFVSPKLDGVRATVYDGILYSRSLKPIPNKFVQELFCGLPEGADGELIVGEPNEDPYRKTVSIVMSDDKPLDFYGSTVRFFIFDNAVSPLGFQDRYVGLQSIDSPNVVIVPHLPIGSLASLEQAESAFLQAGYEGLMYRSPDGIYKHGRSSEREQILLKVKRFKDAEARIVEAYEEMENNNVAFKNELGRTARSSAKGGKVGKSQLGGFHVVGVGGDYDGVAFDVSSSSIVHTDRVKFWEGRENYKGQLLTYKYFPTGGDTRPRHPIFKGFRDVRDL
jgi:DNA ligase 1